MDSPAETAAKQLAWQHETQISVDLEVTTITTRLGDNAKTAPAFTKIVDHYIETATGQRFLEFRGLKDGVVVVRSVHYGDRGKFTDVNYPMNDGEHQSSVYVTNHFFMEDGNDRRQVPVPLLFFHVGRKPLNKALPDAQYLGTAECLGRECDLFLFEQVRWAVPQDQVFYLDKKTSVPLQVEAFRDEAARERKQPLSVWKAKSLDSVQGYQLPLKSTMNAFDNDGKPIFTWDFDVTRIKFNDEFPASTFQPVIQPGVMVLDGTTNKSYKTPGVAPAQPANPPKAEVVTQALQAVPPADWSGSVAWTSLAVGVALLIGGIAVWWRRR